MANMKLANGAGTFTLNDNPSVYNPYTVDMADSKRAVSGALIKYPKATYEIFELNFDYLGTTDFNNLKTIFDSHADITFYPYDEIRGTNLSYVVSWQGNFNFKFVDSFWTSGFTGFIIFEEV